MKAKIGPATIPIYVHDEVLDSDGSPLFGQFQIRLGDRAVHLSNDPDIDDQEFLDTLIHELIHAVDCVMGVPEDHPRIHIYATCLAQALTSAGLVDAKVVRKKLLGKRRR